LPVVARDDIRGQQRREVPDVQMPVRVRPRASDENFHVFPLSYAENVYAAK